MNYARRRKSYRSDNVHAAFAIDHFADHSSLVEAIGATIIRHYEEKYPGKMLAA